VLRYKLAQHIIYNIIKHAYAYRNVNLWQTFITTVAQLSQFSPYAVLYNNTGSSVHSGTRRKTLSVFPTSGKLWHQLPGQKLNHTIHDLTEASYLDLD
jgi:hypothetical protein